MRSSGVTTAALAAAMLLGAGADAFAQQPAGCTSSTRSEPPRTVFTCRGGVVIEAETASSFRIVPPQGAGAVDAVELNGRGVLVDLPPRRGRFQILTPHAIASVRGTIYALDVTASATAVFVQEGSVRVTRRDGSEPVTLNAGEGVDVSPGTPLTVKRWPSERASLLLGRFGR
ncbi:iron dicitrate transport regulator FecR [Bosea caraganae]|uniref:Iron dicitrate transport regulator FecR n=1 Tax=Bosea caraganae TaxID=2763117 RepID=A0A370LAH8_9HYPH|nr:FecR domain-containing protein [Bosea caraganae]RDJ22079.1 iron dicitrate transport regulator FecR [Bosea caraganae]RDJ28338.1 iron dicitrate transport regulator FecR [Bosea caraganae]